MEHLRGHAQTDWGFTTPLWPIRYKPLPDELLSSWLVRLAHGHGLKVQTFCNLLFGHQRQVWNRDIDRLAPPWLVEGLAAGTGTGIARARATTLRIFEGLLYPAYKEAGNLSWILAMKIFHRRRRGYGQQFCIGCLRDEPTPHFRKIWRVGLFTTCDRHRCMLEDRCPHCGEPVSFFRIDMGQLEVPKHDMEAHCFQCRQPLSEGKLRPIPVAEASATEWLAHLTDQVDRASRGVPIEVRTGDLAILRNLMKLLLTQRQSVKLSEYVADCINRPLLVVPKGKYLTFESMPLEVRHELLVRGAWLMADLQSRLGDAVRARAVRYSHLVRDFEAMPDGFEDLAQSLLRRRLPTPTSGKHCAASGRRSTPSQARKP